MALILHDRDSGDGGDANPRVLFVRRTSREGDRWSGQMALPGGRRERADVDLAATARRETREEVGVDLGAPIGRLDDLGTVTSEMVVAPFVFTLDAEPELVIEPREVDDTVWIPLAHLDSPEAATTHWYRGMGPFPAVNYDGYVVWGLTHRIITRFLRLIR